MINSEVIVLDIEASLSDSFSIEDLNTTIGIAEYKEPEVALMYSVFSME